MNLVAQAFLLGVEVTQNCLERVGPPDPPQNPCRASPSSRIFQGTVQRPRKPLDDARAKRDQSIAGFTPDLPFSTAGAEVGRQLGRLKLASRLNGLTAHAEVGVFHQLQDRRLERLDYTRSHHRAN